MIQGGREFVFRSLNMKKEPSKYLRDTSQLKCDSGFWLDREIKSIKASENSATISIESGQW